MNSAGRSWIRIGLLVVAGLLLTGCRVTGTVQLDAKAEMRLDLTVSDIGDETTCENDVEYWSSYGLTVVSEPQPDGSLACRVTGTPSSDFIKSSLIEVAKRGEYVVLDLGATSPNSWLPAGDVALELPGPVEVATFGEVSGNRVQLTWDEDTGAPGRVLVVARPGPVEPQWWLPAGLGFLAGVIFGGAGIGLWVRARGRWASADTSPEDELGLFVDPPVSGPERPTPISTQLGPDPSEQAWSAAPTAVGDHSGAGFPAASAQPLGSATAAADPEPEPPDSYWAPPERSDE